MEELLNKREETHGNFTDVAWTHVKIMAAMGDSGLTPVHLVALNMIAIKIARIICGNPRCKEHWDDIAGYARLVSERLDD